MIATYDVVSSIIFCIKHRLITRLPIYQFLARLNLEPVPNVTYGSRCSLILDLLEDGLLDQGWQPRTRTVTPMSHLQLAT